MADLTLVSVPVYFATMAAEHRVLERRAAERGVEYGTEPADYTGPDTRTSLAMGVGSILAPLVAARVVKNLAPGKGRFGRVLVVTTAAGAVATTIADHIADRADGHGANRDIDPAESRRRQIADRVRRVTGPVTLAAGTLAVSTTFASRWSPQRQWDRKGAERDRGAGVGAWVAAIAGWDFIYYWNHRFMHEVRGLWAIHVVHHSSERYNLSTALRQPVADMFGVWVPYGLLARLGIRPGLVAQARAINLLYQYWIHTEVIGTLGPAEEVLNTASHHRVHHGSQQQYLDRNHGSILIVWDRLFGTFEREGERVRYGLTRNIHTFAPTKVASHEYRDIVRDVRDSRTWRDRLGFVLRTPGWAYARRAELDSGSATPDP